MYERILGNYLVQSGRINESELERAIKRLESSHVKLGTIAVAEKYLTPAKADEVNALQAKLDKKFGDIAVERGYLTAEQVENLVRLQGNPMLKFTQALVDEKAATLKEVDDVVEEFRDAKGYTQEDINTLMSGDIEKVVPLLLRIESSIAKRLFTVGIRTAYRLMDRYIYMDSMKTVNEITVPVFAGQKLFGQHAIFTGFGAQPEAMLTIGRAFAGDSNVDTIEDALDSVCEFLNCVNGFLAIEYSLIPIDLDMEAPEYYAKQTKFSGKEIYALPLTICGEKITYIVSIDNAVEVS